MGQESGRRPKFDSEKHESREAADDTKGFNSTVGDAIRRARQERGWTQAVLADTAKLSPNYIARLERGELGPSLFVAHRICEALAIDVSALLGSPANARGRTGTKRKALAG
ncbi:MAG TPA: helix-turn-helix transcriptional regulator [Labilithrix sp.]|jgi:transcriptional regulator with XRE-family HTH domain